MDKELLLEMYRKMLTIRRFEESVVALFAKGLIPGFVHMYIGEEAIDYLDALIKRVAALDVPIPFSPMLERQAVLDENSVIKSVKEIVS